MGTREVELTRFRWLVRWSLLLSVALVTIGLYALLRGLIGIGLLCIGAGILFLVPSQYFLIRPHQGSERTLWFLTRKECTLCDEAKALLGTLTAGTPLRIEERDVDEDRFLRRHFRKQVPVLLWQGEVLAAGRWELEVVKARLAEIRRAHNGAPPPSPGPGASSQSQANQPPPGS